MTGRGHRFTSIGAAFAAAAVATCFSIPEGWIAGVVAAFSTTLPDWLEIPRYKRGVRVGTRIKHRTITHWGLLWVALLVWGVLHPSMEGLFAIGASVGSLYHLLGDAPNPMGVPWLWPTKRLRIGRKGLWRSGQYEFLFGFLLNAVGIGFWLLASGKVEITLKSIDFIGI